MKIMKLGLLLFCFVCFTTCATADSLEVPEIESIRNTQFQGSEIIPTEGKAGDEVEIIGDFFGPSRGDSYVTFNETRATEYLFWSATKIICKVPEGATSGLVRVVTEWGTSNGVPFKVLLDDVRSEYYFAEGYTGEGFEEWLSVFNASERDCTVQVSYIGPRDEDVITNDYPIKSNERLSVNVNNEAGPGRNISLLVRSNEKIAAERTVYFNYKGVWTGGHAVTGADSSDTNWYFAEGYTGTGFEQWVCVLNANETDAEIDFRFQTPSGPIAVEGLSVEAESRGTFYINELLGPNIENSLHLQSSVPVVAERPVYFNYTGVSQRNWTGGHCVTGSKTLAKEFLFAEGNTREGFDQWITIQNPHNQDIKVTAHYQVGAGQEEVENKEYGIAPLSRRTLFLPYEAGLNKDVSVLLESRSDFLSERPMYFNYNGWTGGHCIIGQTLPHNEIYFAEGSTKEGFVQWLTLQNTSGIEANISIDYFTEERGMLSTRHFRIPANTRQNILVNQDDGTGAGQGYKLSCRIRSDIPISAEKPMYFNYRGWTGGHCVTGYGF